MWQWFKKLILEWVLSGKKEIKLHLVVIIILDNLDFSRDCYSSTEDGISLDQVTLWTTFSWRTLSLQFNNFYLHSSVDILGNPSGKMDTYCCLTLLWQHVHLFIMLDLSKTLMNKKKMALKVNLFILSSRFFTKNSAAQICSRTNNSGKWWSWEHFLLAQYSSPYTLSAMMESFQNQVE